MTDFVAAESGIRQLHARFIDAVWRKDAEAFGQCFAQDGEWKIAGQHFKGRAAIGAGFAKLLGACERVLILLSTPILDVSKGAATGRIYATEFSKMLDGSSAMAIGINYDRYVEDDGRWRILRRHWALHYRGPADLSAAFVPSPDYGPPPGLPGPDEPTFTRRPL